MKFTDIKEHLKNSAKAIKIAKCESKCANRLAFFKSYDRDGENPGWSSQSASYWNEFESSKRTVESLREQFKIEFAAYCVMRGRTLEEIFTGSPEHHGQWFMNNVQDVIDNWESQLEVTHEEDVCDCA